MISEMKLFTSIGVLDIANFAAGKQAQCIRLNGWNDYSGNVILKIAGEGRSYTNEEAHLLVNEARLYRQDLISAGVRIPRNFELLVDESAEGCQVVMVDEFKGPGIDVKQQLKNHEQPQFLISKMIEFIHNLPAGQKKFQTAVMGDFKPDNWVLDSDTNDLVFVDYFAPKRLNAKGDLYPYLSKIDSLTPKAISFLCGDRRGQISRLIAMIRRDHPDYLDYAVAQTKQVYSDMPEVLNFFLNEHARDFEGIDKVYKIKPRDMTSQI